MRTISNHDNSSAVDIAQTLAPLPAPLPEKITFMEVTLALVNAQNQQIQEKRDDERRGYLMQDIMRLIAQLGIPSGNQRVLKAMTTSQLDAYAEELSQQLKNRPMKHLSVA